MSFIAEQLRSVQKRMIQVDTSHSVTLMAVSKTFPTQAVIEAMAAGQRVFGENYVQEGCAKIDEIQALVKQQAIHLDSPLVWHMIGPLQSNKTRLVAEHFDWVDSIDRIKIAQRLNDQRPENLPALNVCVEVNIDAEDTKSGVSPDYVRDLLEAIKRLPRLRLRGLMCIPRADATPEETLQTFVRMRALYDSLREEFELDTLSMGMSADLELAIEAGTTMVRVGSAIFGQRDYSR